MFAIIRKKCSLTNILWHILHNSIGCHVKGSEEAATVIWKLMRSYTYNIFMSTILLVFKMVVTTIMFHSANFVFLLLVSAK